MLLSLHPSEINDDATDPWGIEVGPVEPKGVDLQEQMLSDIGKQATAERRKRAKVIAAEGELMASQQLLQATDTIGTNPSLFKCRYLQTLAEIPMEKSRIVLPLPIQLLKMFERFGGKDYGCLRL